MNTHRKFLSIAMALIFCFSPVLPWLQVTVSANSSQILVIEDKKLYDALKSCLAPHKLDNDGALLENDDQNQTMKLNMEKVKRLQITNADMTKGNSKEILEQLVRECTNLSALMLRNSNLNGFDFAIVNNKTSLTSLFLVHSGINQVPDLTLPNLQTLCLSENDLSADGALDNLIKTKLPKLTSLWMDNCNLTDLDFITNLGQLTDLSLGKNMLTDDDVAALSTMSGNNLSGLQKLNLGWRVHLGDGFGFSGSGSTNVFTDLAGLASLIARIPTLQDLELSGCNITSLYDFYEVRDDVKIDFSRNKIGNFAGLEDNPNITLEQQVITLGGQFAAGEEYELPGLLKRILDEDHVLHGTLSYTNCSLSDDGTRIAIAPNVSTAYVTVGSGSLRSSTIRFHLGQLPAYTVPQNLTAAEGDILASVALPEGFEWQRPALDVGSAGTHFFQAVYLYPSTYIVSDDINIPVTVTAASSDPTPLPNPTSSPTSVPTPSITPTPSPKPIQTTEPASSPLPTSSVKPPQPAQPTPSIQPTPLPKPTQPAKLTEAEKKKQKKREILLNAQLKVRQKGNKINITWGKVAGADGYDVYVQYCSKDFNEKSANPIQNGETTKMTVKKINGEKLDLKQVFKVYVLAYKQADADKVTLAKTITAHVVGSRNTKYTNVKAVKIKKSSYTLKKGKSATIKASTLLVSRKKKKLSNEHAREFRYASTNEKIATVSKKGKIKALGKGSCFIYVYARNGYARKVKIKVK